MEKLSKAERAIIRAAVDHLGAYSNELRYQAEGWADETGNDFRALQLQDKAEGIEEVTAELDEILYRAR